MAYQHKPNKGSMFPNERATKQTDPSMKGTLNVEGVLYWINGWTETTKNGQRYLNLSVKKQEPKQGTTPGRMGRQEWEQSQAEPEFDDPIPF